LGKDTFTVFVITGMVIRKMINNTNMTSTSGVVLIVELNSSSLEPTLIAMGSIPRLTRFARSATSKDAALRNGT
jgi:hypothetical protein